MNFVDDVNLITPACWRKMHTTDNLFANIIYTGAACGVKFVDVRMNTFGNHETIFAGAIRLIGWSLLAQKRLRQKTGRCSFSRPSRTGKKISMTYFVLRDCVFNGAFNRLLPNHILKDLGAIFTVESFCHNSSFPLQKKSMFNGAGRSSAVSYGCFLPDLTRFET